MPNWRPFPFVRLLFPFILGIWGQCFFSFKNSITAITLLLLPLLFALFYFSIKKINWKKRWVFGVLLNTSLVFIGILLSFFHQETNWTRHFSRAVNTENYLQARILEITPKGKNLKLILAVEAQEFEGKSISASGRLLAYLPIDMDSRELQMGDRLTFPAYITKIKPALNPKAFDFSKYWHTQNIHYQVFIKSVTWQKIKSTRAFSISKIAHQVQKKCLHILQKHLSTPNEYAVAAALILGHKSSLDNSLKSAYSDTGAMHVLAVSGLHIGFVYLLINYLLRLLSFRSKRWNWVKMAILLCGLWAFALITGASPSVLRSATMFSFISIGTAINRNANIYNTLAASAFCLLLYDPFLLFAVGFQLSYIAVAGIIYFQPLIHKLWHIKNKWGNHVWQLITVSCAAQLSTFSLSLYYFHKMPLYFWLSGLVVVPGAMIILPLGLVLFIFDKVPFLGFLLGKILYACIWLMNAIIFFLQQLPGAIIDGVWISLPIFLLASFAVISLIFIIESRKSKWVFTGLIALVLILILNIQNEWERIRQKEFVVYHQRGETIIDVFDGLHSATFSSLKVTHPSIDFSTENYRWFKKATTNTFFSLNESITGDGFLFQQGYLKFGNSSLLIVDSQTKLPKENIVIDNVLLTQNTSIPIAEIISLFNCKTIIMDGSNYKKNTQKWKTVCDKLGVKYYDINQKGAWVKRIR